MFCSNCKINVADGVKFCPNCGTAMNNAQASGMYGFSVPTDSALGGDVPENNASGYNAAPLMNSTPGYSAAPPMNSAPPPTYGAPGYNAPLAMNGYPTNYVVPNSYAGYAPNYPMNARQIVCLIFAVISTIYLGLSIILPIMHIEVLWDGVDISSWFLLKVLVESIGGNAVGGEFITLDLTVGMLLLCLVTAVIICSLISVVAACRAFTRLMLGKERWYVAIPMFSVSSLVIAQMVLYFVAWGLFQLGVVIEEYKGYFINAGDIAEVSITPWGWALLVVAILNSSIFIKGYRD